MLRRVRENPWLIAWPLERFASACTGMWRELFTRACFLNTVLTRFLDICLDQYRER